MMMAFEAAMSADGPHSLGQSVILGEERPALPETSQWLGRKKAGAANRRHASALASALFGAKTLGGVFDHRQIRVAPPRR